MSNTRCMMCTGAVDAAALHGRHVPGRRHRLPGMACGHAVDVQWRASPVAAPRGTAGSASESVDGPHTRGAGHRRIYHCCRRSLNGTDCYVNVLMFRFAMHDVMCILFAKSDYDDLACHTWSHATGTMQLAAPCSTPAPAPLWVPAYASPSSAFAGG